MYCQCVSVIHVCLHVVNPFIVTDPQSQLTVNDSSVNFTCTAIAFPSPHYNWTTPIPNSDFNTSTITIVVDYSFYGNYTCFAKSNGTVAPSQPALLTGSYVCVSCDVATCACVYACVPVCLCTPLCLCLCFMCVALSCRNWLIKHGNRVLPIRSSHLVFLIIHLSCLYTCLLTYKATHVLPNIHCTYGKSYETISWISVTTINSCNVEEDIPAWSPYLGDVAMDHQPISSTPSIVVIYIAS